MKLLILLALVALSVARPDYDQYDFDDYDVDTLISNMRFMKAHVHCFIGDGPCTVEGQEVKNRIPEAYTSSCSKCTDKQKVIIAKFIKAMKPMFPEDFATLRKKIDPENKYNNELETFLQKYAP